MRGRHAAFVARPLRAGAGRHRDRARRLQQTPAAGYARSGPADGGLRTRLVGADGRPPPRSIDVVTGRSAIARQRRPPGSSVRWPARTWLCGLLECRSTQAIRNAAVTSPGDHVHVTLSRGELDCVTTRQLQRVDFLTMADTSIKDFEAAIAELESVVKKLEEGDLALEQSLALYERGVQLSRFCHARLEEAERRIEILNERGELKPAPASLAADDPAR
jgi:exodeoxyribonuclease VII small subunit